MRKDAGLTLLEVVLAISLLSGLVAATSPLLLSVRRAARVPVIERSISDLSQLADLALSDPKKVGLAPNAKEAQIAWPGHPDLGPIHVRKIVTVKNHGWLTFDWREVVVSRYVAFAEEAKR